MFKIKVLKCWSYPTVNMRITRIPVNLAQKVVSAIILVLLKRSRCYRLLRQDPWNGLLLQDSRDVFGFLVSTSTSSAGLRLVYIASTVGGRSRWCREIWWDSQSSTFMDEILGLSCLVGPGISLRFCSSLCWVHVLRVMVPLWESASP